MSEKTLNELKCGQTGTITRIGGSNIIRRKMMDMGIVKGTLIQIERLAPLGDPIEIKIRGYHLSLRKEEAADIYVEEEK